MPSIEELVMLQRAVEQTATPSAFESESIKFAQFMLENNNKNIPEHLLVQFWPFLDVEQALTNLNPPDVKLLMDELRIATLNIKMAHPDYEKSYDDVTNWDGMRAKTFSKLMRSTGGMQRERALQATQIRQLLTNEGDSAKGGILSKLGGMFGGRK